MYKIIRDWKDLHLIDLDHAWPVFCDTETYADEGKSDGGLYGKIRLVQLFQKGWDEAIIIDCMFVPLERVLKLLKPHWLVFHNASFDIHTINCHTDKLWLPDKTDDTLYLSRLTFFNKTKFDFYNCLLYCGESDYIIEAIDKKDNQKADWGVALTEKLKVYAACDVIYLAKLWEHVKHKIDTEAYKLDIDNFEYAVEYDRKGIPIDVAAMTELQKKYMIKAEEYLGKIPVNPNSPKQCCAWLKISGSDATTLGVMSLEGNQDAADLLKARHYTKGLQFIRKYNRPTMYGFHNSCGAITGRMSCGGGDRFDHDNLQNPPKILFPAITARDPEVIVYKDYSGLELRTAVSFVGEPTMAQMMFDGEDLHTYTGCHLFDRTPETLTFEERIITKFYNFGTIYGAGAPTLRALLRSEGRLNLSLKEVATLKEKWLDMYSWFREWHNMHKRHLNVYGYLDITTALGRKIRAYNLPDTFNFPIQGTASEVTKVAVVYLYERYKTPDIINVVHDSIGLLKHRDEAELWRDRLNECMIDAWFYVIKDYAIPNLPMPAEACIKRNWSDKGVTSPSLLDH